MLRSLFARFPFGGLRPPGSRSALARPPGDARNRTRVASSGLRPCGITLTALLALSGTFLAPERAHAQAEEASILFERGNQHLARGLRARGRARARELEQALEAYQGELRLGTRTRNVIFNTALTLAELRRAPEAFNYYSEYLRAFDLTADERAEGTRRIDALRPEVAVLEIESAPTGAEVRIDRRDLPVRGTTPLELAVSQGEHALFFTRAGFSEGTVSATAVLGESTPVGATLTGAPVQVQVIAPGGGRLTLDGEEIAAGRAIAVVPGSHLVRLEMPGAPPVERQFEVAAGDAPLRLELSGASAPSGPHLALRIDTPAVVFVDNFRVGSGQELEFPIAPGRHQLRVEAPGHNVLTHTVEIGAQPTTALEVDLGAHGDQGGLYAARAIFGILALGGLGVSTGMLIWAADTWSAWNDAVEMNAATRQLADDNDRATLATDISWGITAAVGLAAFITLFVPESGGEESQVRVVSAPGGAALAWRTP
jgi:hypothetical protein